MHWGDEAGGRSAKTSSISTAENGAIWEHRLSSECRMSNQVSAPLVFVCGHRKAGTTLLRSLLDGHGQLAVYPNDLALLYAYFPDWVHNHSEPQERRDRLRHILFTDLSDRLQKAGLSHVFPCDVLEKRFFAGLTDKDLGNVSAIISRLLTAFLEVTGRTLANTTSSVLKETSIEIYAGELIGWFPQACFVQIVRDPRDNFAALAAGVEKHYVRLGEDRNRTLASLIHRARYSFHMARHNQALLGRERYHLLRFEDLVAAPEPQMRELSAFLGIDFGPSLLVPTILGQPAMANSYEGKTVFAVSNHNAGRWPERISSEEAQIIEFHLADEMRAFGYEPVFAATEQARAAAEFYKWQNYTYFYSDRFAASS